MAEASETSKKKKSPGPGGTKPATAAPAGSAKARDAGSTEATDTKKAKASSAAKGDAPAAAAPPATTKFATFVQTQKIDPRRILSTSRKLERLRPEDRTIKLGKRKAKASEGGDAAAKETRKPRSGRPVTHRALAAALKGGELSGPTKTRILRAVNHLLDLKKQAPVDLRALF
ncbi:MAG TPA: hypothetical protein VEK07_08025 [Polyangiaceae bacterium]|nr:hypothetical protein [Polyangiaceae bacterium]